MGDVIHPLAFVRKAPPFPSESPTSFAIPLRPRNEPADRFVDAVYALCRLGPDCERVGRRALFAFGQGTDGCGYAVNHVEIARAIVQLENLPDDASPVAQHHARIARLAALAVLEPFPEQHTPEIA